MKRFLVTVMITGAGFLAGCTTPVAQIVASGYAPQSPPASTKIFVPGLRVPSPENVPSKISAQALTSRERNARISRAVSAQLAARGYSLVSVFEADYEVTWGFSESSHNRSETLPVYDIYPDSANLPVADIYQVRRDSDYHACLKIFLCRARVPSGQRVPLWAGSLSTDEKLAPESYVQVLLPYFGTNFDGTISLRTGSGSN